MAYRSTNKTVYSAKYHLIWCPKCRVLVGQIETRLVEIIGHFCAEHSAEVIEVETMPDHVHLLAEVPPSVPMSKFIGTLKGRSSRVLRQEFPHSRRLPSLWTPSWFMSTVGGAPLEVVRRYVVDHRKLAA